MTYVILAMLCVIVGLIISLQAKCWEARFYRERRDFWWRETLWWVDRSNKLTTMLDEPRERRDSADWWKEAE